MELIDKDVDVVLVGKNYLSFTLSLMLLNKSKKVLLLDDDRFKLGGNFCEHIGVLEKNFLETLGVDFNVTPFIEIDRYLTEKKPTFIMENRHLHLGGAPHENLIELVRKLPFCFRAFIKQLGLNKLFEPDFKKEFDEAFFSLSQRVAQNICRYKNVQSFNTNAFVHHCPKVINDLFGAFKEAVFTNSIATSEREILNTFLYMGRGYYQNIMSYELQEFELFHLLISILSPHYKVKNDSLLDDLQNLNKIEGGQFKKAQVRQWLFENGRPWSLELSSFEGVIQPKKISLVGGTLERLPLELTPLNKSYRTIEFHFKFNQQSQGSDEYFIFSKLDNLGTSYPMWEFMARDTRGVLRVVIPAEKGAKPSFMANSIKKKVFSDLRRFYPYIDDAIEDEEIMFGDDMWVYGKRNYKGSQSLGPINVKVHEDFPAKTTKSLRSMNYFGPFKNGQLGLLSSLMEIKDGHLYM